MVRWIVIVLAVLALVAYFSVAVLIARLLGRAADRKGRSQRAFFWVSFLLFPIGTVIAWLVLLGSKSPESKN
jgi:MFS family permease